MHRTLVGGMIAAGIFAGLVIAARPGDRPPTAATHRSPSPQISVSTTPALFPDFDPRVSDYVTRCAGAPVAVTVDAPPGTAMVIDGGRPRRGAFTTLVRVIANQSFSFTRMTGNGSSTHHVRCLPTDFPEWQFERLAPAEQDYYVVASGAYIFALNGHGVPLWWHRDDGTPSDAKYLDDGTFAWATGRSTPQARYEIRALDGRLVRAMKTVGGLADGHDMDLLPNGNYMLMSYRERPDPVDLRGYGGPSHARIYDAELQELTPSGTKVWDWNSRGRIAVEETGHWFKDFIFPFSDRNDPFDIVHINSVHVDPLSVLVSMRHTDAVYKIDRASGSVVWKLGGTPTPHSLTVTGDPYGAHPFGGQHDVEVAPDGTLTIFDNGELRNRPPRAVRFRIDEDARTATYVEGVTEPGVMQAVCCGSGRRSTSGGWLIGWGGGPKMNPIVEYAAGGAPTFRLVISTGFSYRVHPIAKGQLPAAALRHGMDTQHPR